MKNAGKACNNRLYRHIRTFEKIVKNYFVICHEKTTINYDFSFNCIKKKEGSVILSLPEKLCRSPDCQKFFKSSISSSTFSSRVAQLVQNLTAL